MTTKGEGIKNSQKFDHVIYGLTLFASYRYRSNSTWNTHRKCKKSIQSPFQFQPLYKIVLFKKGFIIIKAPTEKNHTPTLAGGGLKNVSPWKCMTFFGCMCKTDLTVSTICYSNFKKKYVIDQFSVIKLGTVIFCLRLFYFTHFKDKIFTNLCQIKQSLPNMDNYMRIIFWLKS